MFTHDDALAVSALGRAAGGATMQEVCCSASRQLHNEVQRALAEQSQLPPPPKETQTQPTACRQPLELAATRVNAACTLPLPSTVAPRPVGLETAHLKLPKRAATASVSWRTQHLLSCPGSQPPPPPRAPQPPSHPPSQPAHVRSRSLPQAPPHVPPLQPPSFHHADPTQVPAVVTSAVAVGLTTHAATRAFINSVVLVIVDYMRRVLPATFVARARERMRAGTLASRRRRGSSASRPSCWEVSAAGKERCDAFGHDQHLVSEVRFCVPSDSQGVPLHGEPMRDVELWVTLAGWGRVLVGNIPVPYDRDFCCAFPAIRDAVLHCVPVGTAPPPTCHSTGRAAIPASSEAHRFVISLEIADEPALTAAAEARVLHIGAPQHRVDSAPIRAKR